MGFSFLALWSEHIVCVISAPSESSGVAYWPQGPTQPILVSVSRAHEGERRPCCSRARVVSAPARRSGEWWCSDYVLDGFPADEFHRLLQGSVDVSNCNGPFVCLSFQFC